MFLLLLRVSCRKGNHQATVFASECQFVLYIYIYLYLKINYCYSSFTPYSRRYPYIYIYRFSGVRVVIRLFFALHSVELENFSISTK